METGYYRKEERGQFATDQLVLLLRCEQKGRQKSYGSTKYFEVSCVPVSFLSTYLLTVCSPD
jgi:hypothetical protein